MKFNIKKLLVSVFSISVLLVLAVSLGCSYLPSNKSLKLTDLSGRTVSLDGPAQRIAALSASDCETIYALGGQDKIVARGSYCDYPESVKTIKDVGSGELTNIEELVALKPDVVLMSKTGFTLDQVNAMEKAGLKTLVNEINTFEDTFKYIELIGKLIGKEDDAASLSTAMTVSINNFMSRAADKQSKNLYFQLCPPEYGYWTAGCNTYLNEMALMLNCKNIFEDVDGWAEVSKEQLNARHPDITINVNEDSCFTRPGPRLIEALEKMYYIIYE